MAAQNECPKCGKRLPSDAPAGICPGCLLQAGLASELDESSRDIDPTTPQHGNFVPPEPRELAKFFPQLEIIELLGKGGMGAVYKARQPALDRFVAVKILPPEVGADPAFAERFTREARALAKLSHQSIVSVFDFGAADGQWYFIMEYVDGANLRQLIESGNIKPEQALSIVPRICDALQFAHGEGVVHRDIKPENILVDRQGRVKIADFGLAKLLGKEPTKASLTGTHQVMGTPHYMAPEQMQGSRTVDHRADIYSLGVVFYEMLTGELPIGRFERPSQKVPIDARLDEVVLHALASEPEKRYQRASEVGTDVESISKSAAPLDKPTDAYATGDSFGSEPTENSIAPPDLAEVQSEVEAPSLVMIVLGLLMVVGHGVTIAVCLQNRFDANTAWIGVPGMIVGCFMMIAGLSLRNLWSSGWVYLGAIAALIPAGPGWLITAFVGIWIFNVLARPRIRAAFTDRRRRAHENMEPRFSRKAIIGACWAPFFFVLLLCSMITTTVQTSPARPNPPVVVTDGSQTATSGLESRPERPVGNDGSRLFRRKWWQWVLLFTVLPLGLTAPFGTTILGTMAISNIRHSHGRLTGMPLAAADALMYPLLILDGLIFAFSVFLVLMVVYFAEQAGYRGISMLAVAAPAAMIALPLCAVIDFLLARAVWRKATVAKVGKTPTAI